MRPSRLFATFTLAVAFAVLGAPAAKAQVPKVTALTLSGPAHVVRAIPVTYAGSLTLQGHPVPGQSIEVRVDGVPAGRGSTATDGTYSVQVTFPTAGAHSVQSHALQQSPFEEASTPVSVRVQTQPATAIALGWDHTCALMADHSVRCWGRNDYGQLGDGSDARYEPEARATTSVVVPGLADAIAITAGAFHTCVLIADGTVKCWGYNGHGEAGYWSWPDFIRSPVVVEGLTHVVAIDAGTVHTCALITDGTIRCWGDNTYGQLGDGSLSASGGPYPVAVSDVSDAVTIAAGGEHTCAVTQDATAKCWGRNGDGQLGNGSTYSASRSPTAVTGLSSVTSISAGAWNSCALIGDGSARCWGNNDWGQLGSGVTDSQGRPLSTNRPVVVRGLDRAIALAGGASHTCALMADRSARCWGSDGVGQAGDGAGSPQDERSLFGPVVVADVAGGRAIATGGNHSCALIGAGTISCWGHNLYGQIGDGTTTDRHRPAPVTEL